LILSVVSNREKQCEVLTAFRRFLGRELHNLWEHGTSLFRQRNSDQEGFPSGFDVSHGEDLSLPQDSYFPERELGSIPSEGTSPRYPGLPDVWYLYPVHVPLVSDRCLQNESLNLQHGAGCCFKHPRVTAGDVKNNLFSINGSFSGNTPWQ
jgi:hypothetical protein